MRVCSEHGTNSNVCDSSGCFGGEGISRRMASRPHPLWFVLELAPHHFHSHNKMARYPGAVRLFLPGRLCLTLRWRP